MKHYGDVFNIHGNEIEPVDIITFGSPCQDMSIAGKRAGLDGDRSNLFYEAVRIMVAKGASAVAKPDPDYIIRRLTPIECARLQGFPDWWCSDLETENPTEEEVSHWKDIFSAYCKVIGKSTRQKTDKQIIKWLQHPRTDSAEYKLWGNGVALPCVYFVLSGIAWAEEKNCMSD